MGKSSPVDIVKVGVQEACGTEVFQRVPETEPLMGHSVAKLPAKLSSVSVLLLRGAENFVRTVQFWALRQKGAAAGFALAGILLMYITKKIPDSLGSIGIAVISLS